MRSVISFIAFISLFFLFINKNIAQNYIAQPFFKDAKVRIYANLGGTINPSTVAYTLDVATDMQNAWGVAAGGGAGPNSVVIYNNKIFVSFDINLNKGGVLVYEFANVFPTRNAVAPKVLNPGGGNGSACAGMAINPANGDLYICSYAGGAGNGGIYNASAASNYVTLANISDYSHPSVDYYCANIAFDSHNNLWFTTWNDNANAAQMYLVCYKNFNKNTYYKITNTATKSYTATSTGGVSKTVHLLSAPEGLVFDATGNLWLGNNNDYNAVNAAGEGTLVKLNNSWLNNTLLTSGANNSYTVPTNQTTVTYIPNGKLGGLVMSGNLLYVNDQGQNQGTSYTTSGTVWRYDVTTTLNSTNFKASGIHATYPGNGQMAFSTTILPPTPSTKTFVKADATGLNNGTSWANAYTLLQDAFNNGGLDTIFVAAGTYKPSNIPSGCTNCTTARYASLMMNSNTKLYGGFAGTEKWLSQRPAIGTQVSKIDGDINNDGTSAGNSYHLFFLIGVNGIVVDGFTMNAGNADNPCVDMTVNGTDYNQGSGGALYCEQTTITFNNCIFQNNNTAYCNNGLGGRGGAMYAYWSTTTFNKCTFKANYSDNAGGAIYSEGQGVPYIYDCTFDTNYAKGNGGAVFLDYTNGRMSGNIFTNNEAVAGGGAISMYNSGDYIENTVFYNNRIGSLPTGGGHGAAINTGSLDGNVIRNCTFYNNTANQTSSQGAAIYDYSSLQASASGNIINCIFWNNTTPNNPNDGNREEIVSENTGLYPQTIISNSIIHDGGSLTNLINGGNNKIGSANDPLFTNAASAIGADNIWRTADDGLHPTCIVSPALNGALVTNTTINDITGATRVGNADIGAYEAVCTTTNVFQSSTTACQNIVQNSVTGYNWFHFSNASGIVASINPQGQNLGNVTASVSDPTGIIINGATRYLGRSISLTSTSPPVSNYLLRLYFTDAELAEYKTATSQPNLVPDNFNVLWASGGSGCGINNFYGNTGGVLYANDNVASGEYGSSNQGFYLQVGLNHFTLFAASTNTVNTIVGTENNTDMNSEAFIYPNPTSNDITIEIKDVTNNNFMIQLYDMLGRKVFENVPLKGNKATLQMQDLPNNIYNLIITQNGTPILNKKVIKQ